MNHHPQQQQQQQQQEEQQQEQEEVVQTPQHQQQQQQPQEAGAEGLDSRVSQLLQLLQGGGSCGPGGLLLLQRLRDDTAACLHPLLCRVSGRKGVGDGAIRGLKRGAASLSAPLADLGVRGRGRAADDVCLGQPAELL
jgi:hypothetical protein